MLKKALFAVSIFAVAAPVVAQDAGQIRQVILPMLQETAPGAAGELLTDCVIASASESERSAMAAASGPSRELGALITSILSRDATIACITKATN